MAELSLFLTQNKPFIYTFGVMPSCQSWDYILLSVSTYVCYVNTCKNSHISITLINNTGHVIPYHLILHNILCLLNLLNLLITPLCLTFRYMLYCHIPISSFTTVVLPKRICLIGLQLHRAKLIKGRSCYALKSIATLAQKSSFLGVVSGNN